MIGITYSTRGYVSANADYPHGNVRVSMHSISGCYEGCRKFTIGEAKAFMEYLSCNLRFQCSVIHTVELSEEARDQLIKDIEKAIRDLEVYV